MSDMNKGITQVMKLMKQIKESAKSRDMHEMTEGAIQMKALLEQQLQMLDQDFHSNHKIRKLAVEYGEALLRCKDFVGHSSGLSTASNFDKLEQDIVDATKIIFIFDFELREAKPDSLLLREDV
jgi:hypothetical protein